MSSELKICDLDPELKAKVKTLRFRKDKTSAAIVAIIDPDTQIIKEDSDATEELQDYESPTIEEVASLLPAHIPRYIVYSSVLNHDDGRVSYPLCFIFVSPRGSKPDLQMLYAGSKLALVKELQVSKVFEVRDLDEVTNEWLHEKLSFFR